MKQLHITLLISLLLIPLIGQGQIVINHVKCYGESTGSIEITPPNSGTFYYSLAIRCTSPIEDDTAPVGGIPVSCATGPLDVLNIPTTTGTVSFPTDAAQYPADYTLDGLPAGEHALTIENVQNISGTDQRLCFEVIPIIIRQPDELIPTPSPILPTDFVTHISCKGASDGTIEVSTIGGIAPYTVELIKGGSVIATQNNTNEGQSIDFTGLFAGNDYIIRITDANLCIKESSLVELTEPTDDLSATTGSSPVSCSGESDGEINVGGIVGGTALVSGDYMIKLMQGGTQIGSTITDVSHTFENLSEGTYQIEIEDRQACIFISSDIVVDGPPIITAQNIVLSDVLCNGAFDGSISLEASGGTPFTGDSYNFELQDNAGNPIETLTEVSSANFTNLSVGSYQVLITDQNNCDIIESFNISQPALIQAVLTPSRVICKGENSGSITADLIGGTAPYTIQWTDNAGNPLSAEITLSASDTQASLDNIATGTYRLQVRDSNNCPEGADWYISSASVVEEPTEVLSLSELSNTSVACNGESNGAVLLEGLGGWGGYTYSDNGVDFIASPNFTGLSAGSYTFYVRDTEGCEASFTTEIIQPDPLMISLLGTTNILCKSENTGSIEVSATGGNDNYEISSDGMTWILGTTLSNLIAGTYDIQIRDGKGCTAFINGIILTEPNEFLGGSIADIIQSTCGEANGSATAVASGGTASYTYEWFDADNNLVASEATFTGFAGFYRVVITDANNCTFEISDVNISDLGAPVVSVTQPTLTSCYNTADGVLLLEVIEGQYPIAVSFEGSSLGTLTVTDNSLEITDLAQGNYIATLTDDNGCVTNLNLTVTGPDELLINIIKNISPTCSGGTDGLLEVDVAGGTIPYTFAWSMPEGAGQTTSVTGLAAGTYTLNITDVNNCQTSLDLTLDNPPPVQGNFPPELTICTGQEAILDAGNEGSTYNWTGPDGFTSNSQFINVTQAGTYQVSIKTPEGCVGTPSLELITRDDLLEADFVIATEAVVGDTIIAIDISFPIPEQILWEVPEGVKALQPLDSFYQEFIFSVPGQYTIGLSTSLGNCQSVFEKVINVANKSLGGQQAGLGYRGVDLAGYNLFPNPSTGEFTLSVELNDIAPLDILIYDSKGHIVKEEKIQESDKFELDFDLKSYQKGLYFIRLGYGKREKIIRVFLH